MTTATTTFDLSTHNGFITVQSIETGQHRTFRVSTARSGGLEGQRIVSLLVGPDRNAYQDWQGFATVNADGTIRCWEKFRGDTRKSTWEKFATYLRHPDRFDGRLLSYVFSGRCRRCNRSLTVPSSVSSGIGPECAGKE